MVEPGTIIFASDDSDEAVKDARAYVRKMGYTSDDVKLVKRDKMTLVISKRELVI